MSTNIVIVMLLQSLLLLLFVGPSYGSTATTAVSRDHDPTQEQEQQQRRQRRQQEREDAEPNATKTTTTTTPKLVFDGSLYNDVGNPVSNASVQFWHADVHGNYYHPGDPRNGHELQTDSFAYFGTATTDTNGKFRFRTYRPGIYASRPITHIHFKVFDGEQELLTSQFYFSDELASQRFDPDLVLTLQETVGDDGSVIHETSRSIVVDMGLGGTEKLTPPQQEGPFYPLVDFFNVSSDMTTPNALLCSNNTSSSSTTTTTTTSQMLRLVSVFQIVVAMALS